MPLLLSDSVVATGTTTPRRHADWYGDTVWAGAFGVSTSLTDNYAKLQAALDYAYNRGGGPVMMPPGVYNFLSTPVVRDNTWLIGSDWEGTIIKATGSQTAVLDVEAPNNMATYGVKNIGLQATSSSQLYGLRVKGCENGHFRRIRVSGLTATTGAGWNGSEGAWGFYFTPYTDGGSTLRKPINNLLQELYTTDSPNGIKLETLDGTAGGSGGNDNLLIRCYTSGFTGAGFEIWGEANTLLHCRSNSANNNVFCFRFMDSVTTVIACDGDSTNGSNIGGGTDSWGFPLGVRDNSNVGMYFADTCSAVVTNPQGNGCRKRVDFQSGTAFTKVQLLRVGYNKIGQVVGGVPRYMNTERTSDSTLDMSDAGDVVRMNVTTTANTLTVPPYSDVPIPIGTEIGVIQYGTGVTTIAAGAGVTIQKKSGLSISARFGRATLLKITDNVWVASGDLT